MIIEKNNLYYSIQAVDLIFNVVIYRVGQVIENNDGGEIVFATNDNYCTLNEFIVLTDIEYNTLKSISIQYTVETAKSLKIEYIKNHYERTIGDGYVYNGTIYSYDTITLNNLHMLLTYATTYGNPATDTVTVRPSETADPVIMTYTEFLQFMAGYGMNYYTLYNKSRTLYNNIEKCKTIEEIILNEW